MSMAELLQETDLSIEALEEALKRLEIHGIVYHDVKSNTYKLTTYKLSEVL
jgi:DNA-binding IclR family transcriptional regulator